MMVAHASNIRKAAAFADVLVGAIHMPGAQSSPIVVTRDMVGVMKPRVVVMDIAIDQGGCVETSRPTTHRDPTFVAENVIHYCVPNMTSVVARSASYALSNAAWPFITAVADHGLEAALASRARAEARRGDAPGARRERDAGLAPGRAGGDAVSWMDIYRKRVTTAEAAVSRVQSGHRVFLTGNCSVPQVLMARWSSARLTLRDVELCQILTFGKADYADPEMVGHMRINTLFISDEHRRAVHEGRGDFTPCFLSEVPLLFTNGILPIDVCLRARQPARRARVLLVRRRGQHDQDGRAGGEDRHRRGQPEDAAHARRRLHPCLEARPHRRGRLRAAVGEHGRHLGAGTRIAATWRR